MNIPAILLALVTLLAAVVTACAIFGAIELGKKQLWLKIGTLIVVTLFLGLMTPWKEAATKIGFNFAPKEGTPDTLSAAELEAQEESAATSEIGDGVCSPYENWITESACTEPATPSEGKCRSVDKSTFKLSMSDMFQNYAVTGSHKIRVGKGSTEWTTLANLGTQDIAPGIWIQLAIVGNSSYPYKLIEGYIPCAGDSDVGRLLTSYPAVVDGGTGVELSSLDPDVSKMYMNSTVTFDVYNTDNNPISAYSTNESLGTADAVSIDFKLRGTKDYGFPLGAICIDEYNATTFDNNYLSGISGMIDKSNYKPSAAVHTLSFTANDVHSYSLPAMLDNFVLSGSLLPDVKGGVDPTAGAITITCYGKNYCYNRITKNYDLGIEDIDGTLCYQGKWSKTIGYT